MENIHKSTVAIITRTTDSEHLLERCIKVVLQQSFADWVHIIINDGGEAKYVDDLVNKYASSYNERAKVIHNINSVGIMACSNLGIRSSMSDYIVILNDDNSWDAFFLEKSLSALGEDKWPNTKGVFSYVQKIEEKLKGENFFEIKRRNYNQHIKSIDILQLLAGNFIKQSCFLYKRDVLEEVGFYDESLPFYGDWEFNVRFLCKYDITLLNETLTHWHHCSPTETKLNEKINDEALHKLYKSRLINKWLRNSFRNNTMGVGDAFVFAELLNNQYFLTRKSFPFEDKSYKNLLMRLVNKIFK